MLLKSTHLFSAFVLLALLPASYAHAIASPPLGVKGTPTRSDVKRPSANQPCGDGVNIASSLDTSTAVQADANGNVKVTVTSFNGGPDGSTKVAAKVDPSGTGNNFVQMTVSVNGNPAPNNAGSQNIVAQLPAGTRCTGGSKKNKCLVQFVTTSGFGNCVAVSQGSNAVKNSSTSSVRAASPKAGSDRPVQKKDARKGAGEKKQDGKKKQEGKTTTGDKKTHGGKAKVAASKESGGKKDVKSGKHNKTSDKKKSQDKGKKHDDVKQGEKGKVAAKSDSGKGKGGKKDKKKTDGNKQAGTRAARAVLANLDYDARGADVVDVPVSEVDNVAA